MPINSKIPLIAVVGPTASGKTALGIELAKLYNGEIVSADSMQIYEGMDIATAKPSHSELNTVPHHLISCISRNQTFSVADYVSLAKQTISDINSRNKLPVIVGGTGLYISSLLENIQFADIKSDYNLRANLAKQAEEYGNQYLLDKLIAVDPETASSLHENNLPRIIRALEVFQLTGRKLSNFKAESRIYPSNYNYAIIGLSFNNRQTLYDRINKRVDIMLQNGLIDECYSLYLNEFNIPNPSTMQTSAKAIGYKELIPYFENSASLDDCIDKIKLETRHYAKRQLTWFRKNEKIHWIMLDDFDTMEKILIECKKIIAKLINL